MSAPLIDLLCRLRAETRDWQDALGGGRDGEVHFHPHRHGVAGGGGGEIGRQMKAQHGRSG